MSEGQPAEGLCWVPGKFLCAECIKDVATDKEAIIIKDYIQEAIANFIHLVANTSTPKSRAKKRGTPEQTGVVSSAGNI